jgi:hypothetical protein
LDARFCGLAFCQALQAAEEMQSRIHSKADNPSHPPSLFGRDFSFPGDYLRGAHLSLRFSINSLLYSGPPEEGAVKAKAGERVKAGEEIAACGASGGADIPQLHLHAECSGRPVPMLIGSCRRFPIRGDVVINNYE